MVIEITPRSKVRVSPLIVMGVVGCIILALVLGAAYFYLDFRNKKLAEQIQQKEEELRPMEESIAEIERIVIPIKEKIDNFEALILNHQTPIAIYTFFEENSLPNIWFSDFKFTSETREVSLTGRTDAFLSLGQQATIFRESPSLKSLDLTSTDIAEEGGGIDFGMRFIFKGDLFKPKEEPEEELKEEPEEEPQEEPQEEPEEDVN
jgi:hypothetical protein